MTRHVISLPKQEDESAFKVELIIGKTVKTDARNSYFFGGSPRDRDYSRMGFRSLHSAQARPHGRHPDGRRSKRSTGRTIHQPRRRGAAAALQQSAAAGRLRPRRRRSPPPHSGAPNRPRASCKSLRLPVDKQRWSPRAILKPARSAATASASTRHKVSDRMTTPLSFRRESSAPATVRLRKSFSPTWAMTARPVWSSRSVPPAAAATYRRTHSPLE